MIDSVKIGAVRFSVAEHADLHVERDGSKVHLNGHILHDKGQIKVASDLCTDVKIATIWHEALHGILTIAGCDDQPEKVIEILGYGLVSLIRDNPDLVRLTAATGGTHG